MNSKILFAETLQKDFSIRFYSYLSFQIRSQKGYVGTTK